MALDKKDHRVGEWRPQYGERMELRLVNNEGKVVGTRMMGFDGAALDWLRRPERCVVGGERYLDELDDKMRWMA